MGLWRDPVTRNLMRLALGLISATLYKVMLYVRADRGRQLAVVS